MNKIVKDALVLCAFSLVLGFVLGGVYKITEPIIAEATLRKEMEAYKVVFENADTFKEIPVDETKAANYMSGGGYVGTINKTFEAVDAGGSSLGYVIQLTTKGYGDGLVMVIGVQADKTVNGYSITAHQETSGLGTKAFEPGFADQFKGIAGDKVGDVATISGATITSSAVKSAIKAAVGYVDILGGGEVVVETPEEKLQKKLQAMFPEANAFNDAAFDEAGATAFMTEKGYKGTLNKVTEVVDASGAVIGRVVQITTNGYHEGIVLAVGVGADGKLTGFAAVDHHETPGLGSQTFEDDFTSKFAGLTPEEAGAVDAISGATETSAPVIKAVKAAAEYANTLGGAN